MDIEIRCECGRVLDDDLVHDSRGYTYAEAQPCPDCIKEAVDEAKKEAYDEGYEQAEADAK